MRPTVLSVLLALDIVLLVLLAIGFRFVEPGTAAHAISQVSLGVIVLTIIALVVAIRRDVRVFEP
ncbi:hypothetical protein [Halobaculum marinum]|uniref:Uncharacterized protein n=1 Tax=Halobaculum marinum TaxID=3031996 RepID=A0ABD5WXR1_9EURY|nr:hypothetical protein [Halobaculum sp. DT55]